MSLEYMEFQPWIWPEINNDFLLRFSDRFVDARLFKKNQKYFTTKLFLLQDKWNRKTGYPIRKTGYPVGKTG